MFFRSHRRLFFFAAFLLASGALAAAEPAAPERAAPRDVLVYKDGDRIRGRLVSKTADQIVFQSDRFGELRVPAADAVIVPAEKSEGSGTVAAPPPPVAAPGHAVTPATEEKVARAAAEKTTRAAEEKLSIWEWFSPWVLTAKVRNFFGPWHGKFAVSAEDFSDAARRDTLGIEAHLKRKWKADEVQLNGRYDYSKTNALTTTDLVKADGSWRHDFPGSIFTTYRPTVEWNRDFFRDNLPADYVLLQQEIGAGFNLLKTPQNEVRVGASENIFSNWVLPTHEHFSSTTESVFAEVESKLPWRMTLSDRSVYYYSLSTGRDGWENKLELDKKFTETLSIGIRHEIRHNNPDVRASDYRLLRLIIGFDF